MMHQRGETALEFPIAGDRASSLAAHLAPTHLGELTFQPANNNSKEPGVTPPRRVRIQAPPRRPDPLGATDTPVQRVGLAVLLMIVGVAWLIMLPNPIQ